MRLHRLLLPAFVLLGMFLLVSCYERVRQIGNLSCQRYLSFAQVTNYQFVIRDSFAPLAHAAGIVVNDLGDGLNACATDGVTSPCSLRDAITFTPANTPVADIITFSVSGTITLGSALPAIDDDLTIMCIGIFRIPPIAFR